MNKKQQKKINRNLIYYIEWWDAHSGSGWYSEEETEKFLNLEKCICQEVGWILKETEDELVIACRRLKWAEKTNSSEWGMLQKIPKAWVRKKICMRLNK